MKVIRDYTRGRLRQLDRELATISRKLARPALQQAKETPALLVDAAEVERLLGLRKFTHEVQAAKDRVGVATTARSDRVRG